jgi:hypothetical protein
MLIIIYAMQNEEKREMVLFEYYSKSKNKEQVFVFLIFQFMIHHVESQGRGSELMPKWKMWYHCLCLLLDIFVNIFGAKHNIYFC